MANMTIAEKYTAIVNALANAGIELDLDGQTAKEFLTDRIEKAQKKSGAHKVTDEQTAVRNEIVAVLKASAVPMSVSEMQKCSALLGGCSTSKVTSNITPMLTNGKNPNPQGVIVRTMDKKVAKFYLV